MEPTDFFRLVFRLPYDSLKCLQYVFAYFLDVDHHCKLFETADYMRHCLQSDEAHFWLNGYVNKQKCRIWSEANPQVYVETPLHLEKLTVWCALWSGGILQKR
ncbi:hypothetical protein TNCV_827181 [Trichonephila clavipes]|nr:hypothetical protein TNCV_827181 [Trichonephila clavipes]